MQFSNNNSQFSTIRTYTGPKRLVYIYIYYKCYLFYDIYDYLVYSINIYIYIY